MVIKFSVNPPFQVIFVCISLQGFPLLSCKPAELPHPSSRVDLFLTWEPGSELSRRAIPQESAQHLLAGRSVNPSEGEGVGAGGRMRDHKTANLVVEGFKCKLHSEWWEGRIAEQFIPEPSF